jgi:hypothetical protein
MRQQQGALDPDAPPFTTIDLAAFRRAHPGRPVFDADGLTAGWISDPTAADIERTVVQSLARVAAYETDPARPVGEPGEVHLVYVYGLGTTPYGRVTGMDVIRMPLCRSGNVPPLQVVCPCGCGDQPWFEYVPFLGAYYPVSA